MFLDQRSLKLVGDDRLNVWNIYRSWNWRKEKCLCYLNENEYSCLLLLEEKCLL